MEGLEQVLALFLAAVVLAAAARKVGALIRYFSPSAAHSSRLPTATEPRAGSAWPGRSEPVSQLRSPVSRWRAVFADPSLGRLVSARSIPSRLSGLAPLPMAERHRIRAEVQSAMRLVRAAAPSMADRHPLDLRRTLAASGTRNRWFGAIKRRPSVVAGRSF